MIVSDMVVCRSATYLNFYNYLIIMTSSNYHLVKCIMPDMSNVPFGCVWCGCYYKASNLVTVVYIYSIPLRFHGYSCPKCADKADVVKDIGGEIEVTICDYQYRCESSLMYAYLTRDSDWMMKL